MLMAGDEEDMLPSSGSKGLSNMSTPPPPIIVSRRISDESSRDTEMEAINETTSFAGSLRTFNESRATEKETKIRKPKVRGHKSKEEAEDVENDTFKPK